MMTEEQKLKSALQQVENLIDLIQGNEYQHYLSQYLISIQVELQRQLTNLQSHIKIKE